MRRGLLHAACLDVRRRASTAPPLLRRVIYAPPYRLVPAPAAAAPAVAAAGSLPSGIRTHIGSVRLVSFGGGAPAAAPPSPCHAVPYVCYIGYAAAAHGAGRMGGRMAPPSTSIRENHGFAKSRSRHAFCIYVAADCFAKSCVPYGGAAAWCRTVGAAGAWAIIRIRCQMA